MPDPNYRFVYEEEIQKGMQEVFAAALAASAGGLEAINEAIKKALAKYIGPILEELHRRVIIAMLLLFGDDDRVSSVMGDAAQERGPVYRDLVRRSRARAGRQVEDLGDQLADTNQTWYDEWDEEGDFEEWVADRLLPSSRAENIAITETTNAITLGERTVVDEMRRLGVDVDAVWITQRDERVCPVCGPLHSQPSSQWVEDFAYGPPAHPRCRCYLMYFLNEQ